jgi:hypothetical protein
VHRFDQPAEKFTLKTAVLGVALIAWPALAFGNWEFTRWGMSIAELERASRYSVIRNGQGYGCLAEIAGPVTFQGTRYQRVRFCFDSEALLESVELVADPKAYDAVEHSLNRVYGPSRLQRSAEALVPQWIDDEGGNIIRLSRENGVVVTMSAKRQE